MGHQMIAWVASLVLAMGVTWKIVEKWSPVIRRGIKVTNETLDVLEAILDAVGDKKITKEETEVILEQVTELQEALKGK